MRKNELYLLDVFAEKKYAGNQLAVVVTHNPILDAEMQQIAREINFSETAFILSEAARKGGYDVRIFTPAQEVPFAGHPTLGTAHIIRSEILRGSGGTIVLNLKVGQISVSLEQDVYWMKQIEPTFGEILKPESIASVLGLTVKDIDTRFPVQEVSTGLPHIIVPLRSLDCLKRAKTDRAKYFELVKGTQAKAVLVFCPEPHLTQNDISVRMFADAFGISEDPATGSGNGCLAGYLVKHRYFNRAEIDLRSEQGFEIGRPSLLYLKAGERADKIEISVGGKAITIAKGEIL